MPDGAIERTQGFKGGSKEKRGGDAERRGAR